jgi:hypothetical protein
MPAVLERRRTGRTTTKKEEEESVIWHPHETRRDETVLSHRRHGQRLDAVTDKLSNSNFTIYLYEIRCSGKD